MMVPISLFPRNGLMPEGAGARLLRPEFARSSGRDGAKGTNRRGSPARGEAEGATQNPPSSDPRRSRTQRATAERRKDGETDFPLAGQGCPGKIHA
ncbi:hypothetical protein CN095_34835 [Sinorhizobium meliloti]|nr:hypothetical protein CN095_34835 [Sinorhizobium meliloti]